MKKQITFEQLKRLVKESFDETPDEVQDTEPKAALKSISNAQVAEGPNDASIEKARKEFNEVLEDILKDAEKETMADGTFPELLFAMEDAIGRYAPGLKGKMDKLHELASIYGSLVHFNV